MCVYNIILISKGEGWGSNLKFRLYPPPGGVWHVITYEKKSTIIFKIIFMYAKQENENIRMLCEY